MAVWRSAVRSAGLRSVAKAVSTLRTRSMNAFACSFAIAIALSAVKSNWSGTAARASVFAWSVSVLLVNEIALGAAMSSRTSSPTR